MCRYVAILAVMAVVGGASVLAGCSGPKPFVREADANSVEIGYSGDIASSLPRARQHCLQFGRIPQLVEADAESATYDCVQR